MTIGERTNEGLDELLKSKDCLRRQSAVFFLLIPLKNVEGTMFVFVTKSV